MRRESRFYEDIDGTTLEVRDGAVFAFAYRVPLSLREREFLAYVLQRAPCAVTKEELARHVWKQRRAPRSTLIETTYLRVRARLGTLAPCIEQVPGGYRARCRPCGEGAKRR